MSIGHSRVGKEKYVTVDSLEVSQVAVDHLKRSPYLSVRSVACECEQGVVLLRGRVHCYYHKQLAQEAVRGLQGVAQVVNEIEVIDLFCGKGDRNDSHAPEY